MKNETKTNKAKERLGRRPPTPLTGSNPGRRLPTLRDKVSQSPSSAKRASRNRLRRQARMESQGEKLEQARESWQNKSRRKSPALVKRIGRVASGSVHSFVHGKIFEVEQENVGTEGAHRSELVGETALRHGSRFVRRKVREHPAKVVRKAEARYTNTRRTTIFTPPHRSTRS